MAGLQPNHDPAVQEALQWLKDNGCNSCASDQPSDPRQTKRFIPAQAVRKHFDYTRLTTIIKALRPTCQLFQCQQVAGRIVREGYHLVFCILLRINKAPHIETFLRHDLSDKILPVDQRPHGFPDSVSFEDFRDKQWPFCAYKLFAGMVKSISSEKIIAIVSRTELAKGDGSTIYKIQVHPEYDGLQDDETSVSPHLPHTYVLKAYDGAEAQKHHDAEVEAYDKIHSGGLPIESLLRYYGTYTYDGKYYVILEYADVGTLEDFLRETPKPTRGEHIIAIWRGAFDLVEAVYRVHMQHGWHQDIDMENILVRSKPGVSPYSWSMKLADYGRSHFKDPDITSIVMADYDTFGTKTYGAPECYRSDRFSQTTRLQVPQGVDIWSLGCVWSELAVWIVKGYSGLETYRRRRKAATDELGIDNSGCFHDGHAVLPCIREVHDALRWEDMSDDDLITGNVWHGLIENMLHSKASERPSPRELRQETNRRLHEAEARLPGSVRITNAADLSRLTDRRRNLVHDNHDVPLREADTPRELDLSLELDPYQETATSRTSRGRTTPYLTDSKTINQRRAETYGGVSKPLIRTDFSSSISATGKTATWGSKSGEVEDFSDGYMEESTKYDHNPMATGTDRKSSSVHGDSVSTETEKLPKAAGLVTRSIPVLEILASLHWMSQKRRGDRYAYLPYGDELKGLLRDRDHLFLIDDSTSMYSCRSELSTLFELLAYIVEDDDPDGIEVLCANSGASLKASDSSKLAKHVDNIQWNGRTRIEKKLEHILGSYEEKLRDNEKKRRDYEEKRRDYEEKRQKHEESVRAYKLNFRERAPHPVDLTTPLTVYILTDGVWEGGGEPEVPIMAMVQTLVELGLPREQVGVQFIVFGENAAGKEHVKNVDNMQRAYELELDIVDTEPANGNVWKMLRGAIDDIFDDDVAPTKHHQSSSDGQSSLAANVYPTSAGMAISPAPPSASTPTGKDMPPDPATLDDASDTQAGNVDDMDTPAIVISSAPDTDAAVMAGYEQQYADASDVPNDSGYGSYTSRKNTIIGPNPTELKTQVAASESVEIQSITNPSRYAYGLAPIDESADDASEVQSIQSYSTYVDLGRDGLKFGVSMFAMDVVESLKSDLSEYIDDRDEARGQIKQALLTYAYSLERQAGFDKSSVERKATRFVRQQSREIATKVMASFNRATSDNEASPGTELSPSVDRTQDTFAWVQDTANENSASVQSDLDEPHPHENEAPTIDRGPSEHEDMPQELIKSMRGHLRNNSAFDWLQRRVQSVVIRTRGETLQALTHQLLIGVKDIAFEIQRPAILLSVDWDIAAFLAHGYTVVPDLATVVALCEDRDAYQMTTIGSYITQNWPVTGEPFLGMLQIWCEQSHGCVKLINWEDPVLDGQVTIYPGSGPMLLEVTGTLFLIIEIAEQLAWLGCVCRMGLNQSLLTLVKPHVSQIALRGDQSVSAAFSITFRPENPKSDASNTGECWRTLLHNQCVAKGFPISTRQRDEEGLEMPFALMIKLGGADRVTDYNGQLLVKGFEALFVPTKMTDISIVWHLVTNPKGRRISFNAFYALKSLAVSTVCMHDVYKSRHFLGWVSNASQHTGTEDGVYEQNEIVNLGPPSQGPVLSGVTLNFSKIVGMGATFTLGKQDRGIRTSDSGLAYHDLVNKMTKMHVLLYDYNCKRGWLVDAASALLHLLRFHVARYEPIRDNQVFQIDQFQHARTHTGSGAAKYVLIDDRFRKTVLLQDTRIQRKTVVEIIDGKPVTKVVIETTSNDTTVEDRVRYLWDVLQQMYDKWKAKKYSPGVDLPNFNTKLEGWKFRDIVDCELDMEAVAANIDSGAATWHRLVREINAIVLIGGSFGEILRPSGNHCDYWQSVPQNQFCLAIPVSQLKKIIRKKHGDSSVQPIRLADGVFWPIFGHPFECTCRSAMHRRGAVCDRIQSLNSSGTIHGTIQCDSFNTVDHDNGAVIFGERKLRKRKSVADKAQPAPSHADVPRKTSSVFIPAWIRKLFDQYRAG
ncbi:hypothetical protein LTR22_001723 [Elasticomyces elasticus]|nr:hypothetical protein LTR22_001723 [Elasticomyces elasticus]KAK4927975.1 hypothetical protein LTR49_005174 [Elasticomyces elasticus]KAK5762412.1 hypothetical protein LTS12_007389 [Elasticomyces elasticus]